MDTRGKSNAEFRNEVQEILARHESSFDQVHATLQTILTELQALRTSQTQKLVEDVNPFAHAETSRTQSPPFRHIQSITSGPNNTPNHNHTHLKLSFPKFDGEDPTGWIYKAEQYFEFKDIALAQQVQLASFHLEGIALQWHRWFSKFKGPVTWEEFTKAVLLRFGPTDYEDPSEALTRLKQVTTVEAYQEAFEKLSHRVDNLPENFLVGCFIAGLQDEIRLDVKVKQPKTLFDTIGVARLIEERNALQKKASLPLHASQSPARNPSASILGPPPTQQTNPYTTPIRRLTGQEAKERRDKGMCYYCDEKYAPGHHCQRPQIFMIEDSTMTKDSELEDPCGQG